MVGSGGNMKSTLLCGICSEHGDLDYDGKRLALDMLGITVWLDGENVEVTGTLDPGIVLTPLFAGYSPFQPINAGSRCS
jgi:hypothetical protein